MRMLRNIRIAITLAGLASTLGLAGGSGGVAVTFFPAAQVAAAFEKGRPLTEVDGYKVHASRREGPGMAEVHKADTDIIYMLEGSTILVTGGTVVQGRATAPDEIRGESIQGGQERQLVKGDVIIVPNGTPHWFKSVDGPLLYYVVKVTASAGRVAP